jgi:hypothetical protein
VDGGVRHLRLLSRRVSRRCASALGFVALAAACAPPDAPEALERPLPSAALALLRPDTVREVILHPGVVYRYLWSPQGPWAVHLVEAEVPGRCDLGLSVLRAKAREAEVGAGGRERVSDMVGRAAERVIVAVNADFFTPEGTAVGMEIVDGVIRSSADRPTLAWRRGSAPWMGQARSDADGVDVGWVVRSSVGDGVTEAVGGFPDLIDRGARVGDLEVGARPTFAAARHPRSGIAYDTRAGVVWFAVVDGRQPPHSAGMTLPEFAALFESLGADEALNLDGGGSSALVVRGVPANRPSDPEGERAVVNALALVQDPSGCLIAGRRDPARDGEDVIRPR